MRGPRATGNPAAPGSLLPVRDPAGNPEAAAPEHGLSPARRAARLAREHWLLTALLAAGLVLRVLAQ
ncbi:MAG TPA: hypothetical protein VE979_13155, partial [Streptosporangiaceae bacterium]|nr:hypothetical protein [Streptosporangiaceae bacterium]